MHTGKVLVWAGLGRFVSLVAESLRPAADRLATSMQTAGDQSGHMEVPGWGTLVLLLQGS